MTILAQCVVHKITVVIFSQSVRYDYLETWFWSREFYEESKEFISVKALLCQYYIGWIKNTYFWLRFGLVNEINDY